MDQLTLRNTVRELCEPTVNRLGFDLVAVEWMGGSGGGTVRVSIEALPETEGGVTAASCALVSRGIEPLLDASDPISGRYTLEVSSPGIERPVQRLTDFARFQGYSVRLRLEAGPPRRRFTGTLQGIRGDEVFVVCDGEEHGFHVDTIERAHLVLTVEEYMALGEGLPEVPAQEDSDDHQ